MSIDLEILKVQINKLFLLIQMAWCQTIKQAHLQIAVQCSKTKPSKLGQGSQNAVIVSEMSTWPQLEGFVCEQWRIICKWAIGLNVQ